MTPDTVQTHPPTPFYLPDGNRTEAGIQNKAPELPGPVALTAERKGIPLDTLCVDTLMGIWFPFSGWKGMFLGIEPDGHAHT